MTMLRHDMRANERGTFAALADADVIRNLKSLGVTAVELLPIHAFLQDRTLLEQGLKNYSGYNSIGFFAIEPRYLSDGSRSEMRVAVRRLHAAGIEVILDVVYNHTAEGSEFGSTLSFRGLDNASYYRLVPENRRHYINDTGTGNTLNLSHPRVLQMVMDSLRYWVTSFHADGFRFDLGVTLGREAHGFDPGSGFFDALRQDPILTRVKLISEPWDLGPGGYQLGHHPPGFAEWNDRLRDSTRRFWRGDAGERPEFAARLAGSSDLFDRQARHPWASVNYAASHDGFTLADILSYSHRHNEANGEDNNDGAGENFSANGGVEGPTPDKSILETRARIQRPCSRPSCSPTARRCCSAATSGGARRAATTMRTARTTRLPGGIGAGSIRRRAANCEALCQAHCVAPGAYRVALASLPARPARAGAGHLRHRLV
jgi:isoamylase